MRIYSAALGLLTTTIGAFGLATIALANPASQASVTSETLPTAKVVAEGTPLNPTSNQPLPEAPRQSITPNPASVAQATPEASSVRILSPQPSETGDRFTNLVVQYPVGTAVQASVNQKPLDASVQTQVEQDTATNLATQVWYRVPLQPGENVLTVEGGGIPISVTVTVKETAAKIEFLPFKQSRVPADGRSALTVEGQILDEGGNAISQDVVVTLTASAGKFVGADYDKDRNGFQVLAKQGKFSAQLQSGLEPQIVRVRAAVDRHALVTPEERNRPVIPDLGNSLPKTQLEANHPDAVLESYTQAEFITNLRPTLISGTVNLRLGASGIDFYNSYRDFLSPERLADDTRFDFGAAVFATGSIGQWLFTGAINTQRPLNLDCTGETRLFRDTQFCDQTYPTFGDSSTVDYLTPSIDSVYVRLERTSPVTNAGTDFVMWGDYHTPEFSRASQYFTAASRQLHGFKGTYNLGNLQISALYANNVQSFQRDTISPNGTSGYYFLARRLLVAGSESVFLESEEINRPGTVIERKALNRTLDYEIDYDRGALLFRRPILATEFDLFGRTLVRRIVVTYQYESAGGDAGDIYAGRLQYNFSRDLGKESWAGLSYWNEDQGDRNFELYGIDVMIPLGKEGSVIAEYARSVSDSVFFGNIKGDAFRVDASGKLFTNVLGRAYYRSTDSTFANNATFSFSPGQTRFGAEVAAKVTPTTQILIGYDQEENFGVAPAVTGLTQVSTLGIGDLFNPNPEPIPGERVNNSLKTFRVGVTQQFGKAQLGLDYVNRSREDRILPNRLSEDSDQLVSRLSVPITKTLTFRAQDERNLGSGSGDPIYPDRTTLGLEWAVMPGVALRLAHQFVQSGPLDGTDITSLDTVVDHRLSEDTIMTGRYSLLNSVNGLTSQGAIGLNHRIKLAPGLRMNLAYERIFGDIFTYTGAGQQFIQPAASGQGASALGVSQGDSYSVGLEYTDNPNFRASARVEYRDAGRAGDNLVLSASAAGKLSPALTVLGRYQQANFANQLLTDSGLADTVNIKVGLAYRNPINDKFNLLMSYEFRQNPSTTPDTIAIGTGTGSTAHLLSIEGIYAPSFRWEFYGKFALRDTRSFLAKDLIGSNTITLGQARATYRFAYRWDVSAEARWLGQSGTGFDEVGGALELGYYLSPNLRLAGGFSFGRAKDRDFGSRDRDGFYVGLQLKLNDLFGFGSQKIAPPQQRESLVKPVATQPTSGSETK